jgi:hypothetical protein
LDGIDMEMSEKPARLPASDLAGMFVAGVITLALTCLIAELAVVVGIRLWRVLA